jgi:hypothetical protein
MLELTFNGAKARAEPPKESWLTRRLHCDRRQKLRHPDQSAENEGGECIYRLAK